jgi:hypothetical protein
MIYTNEYLEVIDISRVMGELKERDNELYKKILDELIEDFSKNSNKYTPQFISLFIRDINEYNCDFYNEDLINGLTENPLNHIDILAEFKFKNQALYKDITHEIKSNDENVYNELITKLENYVYADIGIDEFVEVFGGLDTNGSIEAIKNEFEEKNHNEYELHNKELGNYRTKIEQRQAEEDGKNLDSKDKVHVIINDYEGTWNSELELPELSHYRFGEGHGRLTDFKSNGMPLKDVIIDQFIAQFKIEFADHLKALEDEKNQDLDENLIEDLDQQDNFRHINSEGFVKREDYTNYLKEYVKSDDNKICLVSAKGGYGKTMLLANFATDFHEDFADIKLYSRFCGNSKLSSKTHSLWKSIVDEAGISENEEFYPHNIDELRRNIDDILNKLSEDGKTVIIIDAVNQLDDGLEMFKWLGTLPSNLKLIISAKVDDDLETIINMPIISEHSFELGKLDSDKEKSITDSLNNLNDYVEGDDKDICLVKSNMNYDKTLIFDKFREDNPDKKIVNFSCKVQNSECPSSRVKNSVTEIVGKCDGVKTILEDSLSGMSNDSIVIIDVFGSDETLLENLSQLSHDFKLIIGVKKSDNLETIFKNTSENSFELSELDGEKNEIIQSYLSNYLKELDEKEIHDICNFKGSENPLYLKILLAELRVFGSFDQLKDKIKEFGTSPLSAFNQVLERLEKDEADTEQGKRGIKVVPLLFSLLSSARVGGLSENELVSIIVDEIGTVSDNDGNDITEKFVQDSVRLNLRQVRPFMARKEAGRHDFFYEQFREASENKYADKKVKSIELLTKYFRNQADPSGDYTFLGENPRAFIELPYYLNESGDTEALEKTLSTYAFIKNKLDADGIYNLILDYRYTESEDNKDDQERPLALIKRALELSAPVLMNDKDQLPAQLWGRMVDIDDEVIYNLLNDLEKYHEKDKWLKSSNNALYSPKSAIIKRLRPDGKKSSTAIVLTNDDKIVMGSEDGVLNLYNVNDNTFEVLEKKDSKIIKIILNEDGTIYVARSNGDIKKWDLNIKNSIESFTIDAELRSNAEITDIYHSKTYNKIYASSHTGVYTINLETEEIRREDIASKDYNQILVPRRNEAILVCDDKEVDGWDVYEMRKAFNKHHQQNITDDEDIEGEMSTKTDSSGDIKFMGLIKRFIILISENGQMKMWNTLQNSGGGQSIDEKFTSSLNDQFRQAITLENERQVITMSKMGVLRVWNIPEPKNPTFRLDTYEGEEDKNRDIQTGIVSTTAMGYYNSGKDNWVIIGNEKSEISIIDLNKPSEEADITKHTEAVLSIKVHGDEMITASENGEIYVWDLNDKSVVNKFSNDFRSDCISYDYNNGKLVSAGIKHEKNGLKTNKLAVLNIKTNEVESEDKKQKRMIDIAQNSKGIVFIDEDDLTIGNDTVHLDGTPTTLCTEYDTSDVFIGYENGQIARYGNAEFKSFDGKDDSAVTKIKIADDKLIAGHENGTIEVFDTDGSYLFALTGHEDAITNINVSSNSEFITVSKDNALKLWDIDKKECIYTYYADIYATSVNVSGDKIIIGDTLGNVRFFNFS